MTLNGPGGDVAIGGDPEDCRRAFPAPSGAEVFDTTMSFTVFCKEGWSWGEGMGTGFESGWVDGKIVALAHTRLDGPAPPDAIERERSEIGEPTRMSEGSSAAVMVWEHGPYARIFVLFKEATPMYGAGSLTIIADKEKLKLLGYLFDQPETTVEQLDATVEQFKKATEERSGEPDNFKQR